MDFFLKNKCLKKKGQKIFCKDYFPNGLFFVWINFCELKIHSKESIELPFAKINLCKNYFMQKLIIAKVNLDP